jgi:diadenosine tetraphosphate (Ap4A) HIT family hydrolase
MTLTNPLTQDAECECGFVLWNPIAQSDYSSLGLYDDARFPGRSILRLKTHYDSLEEVPTDILMGFMQDVQVAMAAIRTASGAARVNVAILGNRDPHVHAHLVPRFPLAEEFPDCSPWNDLRLKTSLPVAEKARIIAAIGKAVEELP